MQPFCTQREDLTCLVARGRSQLSYQSSLMCFLKGKKWNMIVITCRDEGQPSKGVLKWDPGVKEWHQTQGSWICVHNMYYTCMAYIDVHGVQHYRTYMTQCQTQDLWEKEESVLKQLLFLATSKRCRLLQSFIVFWIWNPLHDDPNKLAVLNNSKV